MKLREFSNMVIGPEFIEETDTSILIKDLLNPLEMPIQTFAETNVCNSKKYAYRRY